MTTKQYTPDEKTNIEPFFFFLQEKRRRQEGEDEDEDERKRGSRFRKDTTTGGTVHLEFHPLGEAFRVEDMVTRCYHVVHGARVDLAHTDHTIWVLPRHDVVQIQLSKVIVLWRQKLFFFFFFCETQDREKKKKRKRGGSEEELTFLGMKNLAPYFFWQISTATWSAVHLFFFSIVFVFCFTKSEKGNVSKG